ncbi:MAG: L-seryl-tRNA(Sec) selenium transferase [Pirellulales bacterium]|nr:L-seryl-tRNA(Sec) selenium transferase [Pirellulales bacterium]
MSVNPLRNLPSIHELLENPTLKALAERLHPSTMMATARMVLDEMAAEVHNAATEKALPSVSELAERISRRVLEGRAAGRRAAINATGVLLHPELGDPPWADVAVEAFAAAASGYTIGTPLPADGAARETDLVAARLKELTGAEGALVFSSAAAATMATLAAIVGQQEVIVARGQVIERDDRYHLAELAAAAPVLLREVGAANRVRLDDYRRAVGEWTGAILLVHRGEAVDRKDDNDVALKELVHLGREKGLPVIHDLGPAGLIDLDSLDARCVPVASQSVEAGVDLVVFGHELLGGPRCGVVVGRRGMIDSIEPHAIARASVLDRPALAALAATLDLTRSADQARQHIPLLQLLTTSADNLKSRAERMALQMAAARAIGDAEATPAQGALAGRSGDSGGMAGWAVALRPESESVEKLAEALRGGNPAVIGEQRGDRLLLNLRSVLATQDIRLVEIIEGLDLSS